MVLFTLAPVAHRDRRHEALLRARRAALRLLGVPARSDARVEVRGARVALVHEGRTLRWLRAEAVPGSLDAEAWAASACAWWRRLGREPACARCGQLDPGCPCVAGPLPEQLGLAFTSAPLPPSPPRRARPTSARRPPPAR